MKTCPVCSSENWQAFYKPDFKRIMTGDQRIGEGQLEKIICDTCGVVSNKTPFTPQELNLLYGEEYELNTLNREEHLFFTKDGPIARSQTFADWIAPFIPEQAHDITEIGCGEGLLLSKLQQTFPEKHFLGFDGSKKATALACEKGLQVKQKLFLTKEDCPPPCDVLLLINVIEHLENISDIISTLRNAVRKNGRLIFCLPIQDFGGYDLFFAEHVWHFTTAQVLHLLNKNGLNVIHYNDNHPINHGIGLFVCEPDSTVKLHNPIPVVNHHMNKVLSNWTDTFSHINYLFRNEEYIQRIAVFGSGEVFTLFYAFTELGNQPIITILDETKSKIGTKKHGITINHPNWLKQNKIDAVFLAINNKYFNLVSDKLAAFNIRIIHH